MPITARWESPTAIASDGGCHNVGNANGTGGTNGANGTWACSDKQRELIEKIVLAINGNKQSVDALSNAQRISQATDDKGLAVEPAAGIEPATY